MVTHTDKITHTDNIPYLDELMEFVHKNNKLLDNNNDARVLFLSHFRLSVVIRLMVSKNT